MSPGAFADFVEVIHDDARDLARADGRTISRQDAEVIATILSATFVAVAVGAVATFVGVVRLARWGLRAE